MNIFAQELAQALAKHGKELSSLYTVKSPTLVIPPSKVTRLKRSLIKDRTATLNADELELVRKQIAFQEEEIHRLRAALVAETVRYVLAGRMSLELANRLAEVTFQMLVVPDAQQMMMLRHELLDQVRDVPSAEAPGETDDVDDPIERALDAAAEEYEHGSLWLEMARDTADRGARLGYLGQAKALLARARMLAANPPTIAVGTPLQAELLALIDAARADADALG